MKTTMNKNISFTRFDKKNDHSVNFEAFRITYHIDGLLQ